MENNKLNLTLNNKIEILKLYNYMSKNRMIEGIPNLLFTDVLKQIEDFAEINNISLTKKMDLSGNEIIFIITECVAEYYKQSVEDIICKGRDPEYVVSRQMIYFFSYAKTKLSLAKIGYQIGQRDHSTVFHNIKEFVKFYKIESRYKDDASLIKLKLLQRNIDITKFEFDKVFNNYNNE